MPRSSDKRSGDRHRKVQPGNRHSPDDVEEMRKWAACHGIGLSELLDRAFRHYAETHGVDGSLRTEKWLEERQDPEAWTSDGRFVGYRDGQGSPDDSQPESEDGPPEMAIGEIDVSGLLAERRKRRGA